MLRTASCSFRARPCCISHLTVPGRPLVARRLTGNVVSHGPFWKFTNESPDQSIRNGLWLLLRDRRVQLAAGRDAQFWEDPVQMGADGPVRNVELLADLAVGHAVGGHPRDLQFLRRQLIPGPRVPAAARFAGGPEFQPRSLGKAGEAEGVKGIPGSRSGARDSAARR